MMPELTYWLKVAKHYPELRLPIFCIHNPNDYTVNGLLISGAVQVSSFEPNPWLLESHIFLVDVGGHSHWIVVAKEPSVFDLIPECKRIVVRLEGPI